MDAIQLVELTKQYKHTKAIDKVNLSVEEGDFYGFIGPNGAGKSTAIKILTNFIYPTSGKAKIFGKNCMTEACAIKKFVGYVSSDIQFYKEMTSAQLLRYVCEYKKIYNREKVISYYTELLDIELDKKVSSLSLGNRKKLAIASGLMGKQRLLILDEPTSGLDPLVKQRLYGELQRMNQEGVTIFLSSHDLNEVQENANKTAFIKEGKIVMEQDIQQAQALGKVVVLKGENISITIPTTSHYQVLQKDSNEMRILVSGDKDEIWALVQQPSVEDFLVLVPSLDDKFMSLYKKGVTM